MFSEKDLLINLPESDIWEGSTGHFSKKILIVSKPEFNVDFCSKVLMAAQVDFENDAKLLTLPKQASLSLLTNIAKLSPQKIIVFGCEPDQLGMHILASKYVVFDFFGISWLFTDALDVIEADRNKKSQLWLALKSMFDLS